MDLYLMQQGGEGDGWSESVTVTVSIHQTDAREEIKRERGSSQTKGSWLGRV